MGEAAKVLDGSQGRHEPGSRSWGGGVSGARARGAAESRCSSPPPVAQGVVPFLGTYLKYLVMLDTVMGDSVHVSDPGAGGVGRVPEAWGRGGGESLDCALSLQRCPPFS